MKIDAERYLAYKNLKYFKYAYIFKIVRLFFRDFAGKF